LINWKYFSLEQVNDPQGAGKKIWEQPEDFPSPGFRAFRAAEAARQQGPTAFDSFHFALLKVRHEQRKDIADPNTLISVAQDVKLDLKRFQNDLGKRKLLNKLAADHTHAVEKLGIFGTPTLVFPGGQAIFLKMFPPPPPDEAVPLFAEIQQIAVKKPYILEIKRPRQPEK